MPGIRQSTKKYPETSEKYLGDTVVPAKGSKDITSSSQNTARSALHSQAKCSQDKYRNPGPPMHY